MPPISDRPHWAGVGLTHTGIASGTDISVISSVCHSTMTAAESRRVSTLVTRNEAANTGADASISRLYQPPVPASPGPTMTSTPAKPTATATHRAGFIGSLSSQAAPISTNSGLVKLIAVMSASGMCGSAVNHRMRPSVCRPLRQTWPLIDSGHSRCRPPARTTIGTSGRMPTKYRRNCACIGSIASDSARIDALAAWNDRPAHRAHRMPRVVGDSADSCMRQIRPCTLRPRRPRRIRIRIVAAPGEGVSAMSGL